MDYARYQTFGNNGCTDDCSAVIEQLDQIMLLNPPRLCLDPAKPCDPVVMPIYQHPVILDVVDHRILTIAQSVETETWMWCDELQGISLKQLGCLAALPGRHIPVDRRASWIVKPL